MHKKHFSIWLGWDTREAAAFAVARESFRRNYDLPAGVITPVKAIVADQMRQIGLYHRPVEIIDGRFYDLISEAPMSTEFAITRFLTPYLAKGMHSSGWALFADSDVLCRSSLFRLYDLLDDSKALMCVQHKHAVAAGSVKMDGQAQLAEIDPRASGRYSRKNWSSVMAFNLDHPANQRLTVGMVNELPGRDLHRFCWLDDDEIGELPARWNYLVGHTKLDVGDEPALVHFTDGYPMMPGYENVEFADEWRAQFMRWANGA